MNYERKYNTAKKRLDSALKSVSLLQQKCDELQNENTSLKVALKDREEKIDSLLLMVDQIKKEHEDYRLERMRYKKEYDRLISSVNALKKNYYDEVNKLLKNLKGKI